MRTDFSMAWIFAILFGFIGFIAELNGVHIFIVGFFYIVGAMITMLHTHPIDDGRIRELEKEVFLLKQKDVTIPKEKTITDIMGVNKK
jgi:cell division protein FtsW (lipid II flippase)